MPKLKLFLFLSVFQIFINIASFLNTAINNNSFYGATTNAFDILGFISSIGISFIPFTSLVSLVFSNLSPEALAFICIFTGIITIIQTYLIIEIVASHFPTVNI